MENLAGAKVGSNIDCVPPAIVIVSKCAVLSVRENGVGFPFHLIEANVGPTDGALGWINLS